MSPRALGLALVASVTLAPGCGARVEGARARRDARPRATPAAAPPVTPATRARATSLAPPAMVARGEPLGTRTIVVTLPAALDDYARVELRRGRGPRSPECTEGHVVGSWGAGDGALVGGGELSVPGQAPRHSFTACVYARGESTPRALARVPGQRTTPWLYAHRAAAGFEAVVLLGEDRRLDDDARSVAMLVADERPARGWCDDDAVAWEVGREVFDALAFEGHAFELVVPLERRGAAAARRAFAWTCVRDLDGALDRDLDGGVAELPDATRWDAVVATPSGRFRRGYLEARHRLTALDPVTGASVEAGLLRVVERRVRSTVTLQTELGLELVAPAWREYWSPSAGELRRADTLAVGDTLRHVSGATPRVLAIAEPSPTNFVERGLDVGFPDTYFLDGVLVGDEGRRPSPRPPNAEVADPAPAPERDEPAIDVRAMPESWDCGLLTRWSVRRWPEGATSVDLVVVPHEGDPGARAPISCEPGRAVASLSAATVQTALRAPALAGRGLELMLELSDNIDCSRGYTIGACLNTPSGAQPLELGRYGLSGPPCFVAGTRISTPDGPRAIETLRVGDAVRSYDVEAGAALVATVVALRERAQRPVSKIMLTDGRSLEVTAEHPLYRPALGGFRPAAALRPGATLLDETGRVVTVRSVGPFTGPARVYNLSVSGPRTYYAAGVLVHNY